MTASLLAALLLNFAQAAPTEPELEAVNSLDARHLQQPGGPPANNDMRAFCDELGAGPCLWTETSAVAPALAQERLSSAYSRTCTAASGVFDDPKDLAGLVELIGARRPEEGVMGVLMADHTCRTRDGLSGVRAITYDFGKVAGPVGAPPRRGLAAVVNPNRSSYDALTGLFVFSAANLRAKADKRTESSAAACAIERDRAIVSGAETDRGLVVERRGATALVQPPRGSAVWIKTADLRPLEIAPGCAGEGNR